MTQTAQTILTQLGGRKFLAMTGAKNLVAHTDGALSFKLPANFAAKKINCVKISYDEGRDLYDMTFDRIWGVKMTKIAAHDGVYFDMLRDIFTQETGLDTSL